MNRTTYRVTATYTLDGRVRRTSRTVDSRSETAARSAAAGTIAYDIPGATNIITTNVKAV